MEQLGSGCTAALLVKIGRNERKKYQMERIGYNSRWMVGIIVSSFKRLLSEAFRTVKFEYVVMEITTKIAMYNKLRDVMRKATG